jgi:peptidoglycan/LPS O-acetylase OafA/YrhL
MSSRFRYLNFLQIAGALYIIAFHVRAPHSQAGWLAVEMFFVLAGFNMVKSVERHDNLFSYVSSRACRLLPEVSIIWCVCLIMAIAGWHNRGITLFLFSAPVFLQNFIEPFFSPSSGINWIFIMSLWFVGALLQLQIIVFMLRRFLLRSGPIPILCFSFIAGMICRVLLVEFFSGIHRDLSQNVADTLYRMPFCHIEAITLGLMLRRGILPRLGHYLPAIGVFTLSCGLTNMALCHQKLHLGCIGFPAEMQFNYQYLWGYPLLAITMASLCSMDGPFARIVEKVRLPVAVDKLFDKLAYSTYAVYVFHGVFIIAGEHWLRLSFSSADRLPLFIIVVSGAFLTAWVFQSGANSIKSFRQSFHSSQSSSTT